jgi:light-regulated signal transduction histidine kinase (bacteriophytochrome)
MLRAKGLMAVDWSVDCLARAETGGFTRDNLEFAVDLGQQAVIAIENARLFSELQAAKQNATAELALIREIEGFSHVSAHDLQEPLRKIQAFSDLLQTRYNPTLDEKGRTYILRIQQAASRMQTLITDLRTFSRIATETQQISEVSLTEVCIRY